MIRILPRLGAPLLFLGALMLCPVCAPAAADESAAKGDTELVAKVSKRLLDVCEPPAGFAWPPDFTVIENEALNAYAYADQPANKPYEPHVRVFTGLMKRIIQGDPDRLALIMGHELSHVLLHHVIAKTPDTNFKIVTFTRDQELAADHLGMELMLKAGFSFRKGRKAFERINEIGGYSSFEGLSVDHPAWNDRMALIDEPNSKAWKAMSAFENGVLFLTVEQYPNAVLCFDRVTKEFPACHEAWVNLGYACLMEYCDKLDANDLRDYNIGPVLTGGFYLRPQSISVRGKDAKLWWKAVGALKEALRIKDNLWMAKADLGLAYLVHPEGKDVGEATRFLTEAVEASAEDKDAAPSARAALLVNLGVSDLAAGDAVKGLEKLQQGEKIGNALAGARKENTQDVDSLVAALTYNRALLLSAKKDRESQEGAVELFEKYLHAASPLSLWWTLAYEHYETLCKSLERPVKEKDSFTKNRIVKLRLVISVKLKAGDATLGEDLDEVVKKLGKGRDTVAVPGTNMHRLHYDKDGVNLLVTDTVLAICLVGADAPAIPIRGRGANAAQAGELRIGMSVDDVRALLGDYYELPEIVDAGVKYDYYRDQGVAVRFDPKGRVVEVVLVQLPKA